MIDPLVEKKRIPFQIGVTPTAWEKPSMRFTKA